MDKQDKITAIVITIIIVIWMLINEVRAVSPTTMEEINVVQMMYDQGIEKYEQGGHKQGCYMIHQAVKQAWLIQGDDKFTYKQLDTLYQELCKR
jgi:hypothetical protein